MLERSSLQPDVLIAQLQAQIVQLQQQNNELRARLQTYEQSQSSLRSTAGASNPKHCLLEATAAAANALLTVAPLDAAVNTALQVLGEALEADRVKILECVFDVRSNVFPAYYTMSYEWITAGTIPQIYHPSSSHISNCGAEAFMEEHVFQNDGFGGLLQEWPESFWRAFEAVQAKGIYCVPIRVKGQLWGVLVYDDCQQAIQRDRAELTVLRVAAGCVGSAIERDRLQQAEHQTQQALLQTEQARVEQISQANAALAQANQKIIAQQAALALQLTRLAEKAKQAAEAQRSAALAREQEQAAQERAAELAKANEALRGTTDRLANEPSLNTFLGHVISEACGQLGCDAGAIFLYDAASEQLSMTVSVGLENNFPYSEQILMPTASYPGWSLLLQTRKPLFLHPDLNPELFTEGTAEWHRAQGHHGILVTALMLGDRPLGQIAVAFRHKHRFTETDLELFQALAQQVTLAVQLMQLAEEAKQAAIAREQEKAAQERVAELVKANAALQNCANQLAGQLNPESFINHVLLEAAAQVDAYSAALFIYNDAETASMQAFVQNGQVQSIATHPDRALFRPPVPRDDLALWDLALSRNQAVFFNIEDEMTGIWLEWHRSQGNQSIVRVPLPLGSHLLGFISFCFQEARSHLPANIELVLTLAQQATVALHLAQLAEENRRAVLTEERNRIAREIHDTLAQTFIGISIQVGIAQRFITTSPSDTQQILDRVIRLAQTGLAEARSSVWALHPTADEYADLLHKLPLCVQQLTDGLPIQAEVSIAGTPCTVSAIVGQNLLRIAQEAVNNAIHYANATVLHVRLSYEATRLELSIQDNGCGFDPGIENGGFGLMSMFDRAARLNGQLTIDSQLGQGTEIRVEVPIE